MKAIVKEHAGVGLVVRDVPIPTPGTGEVLVKIRAASICGTDVHIYQWDKWSQSAIRPPVVLGHEFTGEIVEVGKNVAGWKKGDLVSLESHIPCDACYQCKNGFRHICDRLKIMGIDCNGGFAEYAAVPAVCLWRVPSSLPLEVATVMEPLGNAVHAGSVVDVRGKNVVVFGCGPTGLFATAVLKALEAARIAAVDINLQRLDLAMTCGATKTFNGRDEGLLPSLTDYNGGAGADIVLEMSGSASGMNNGLKTLRKGGTLIAFGLSKQPLEIDVANDVIMKGRKIIGVVGRLMFETWQRMQAMLDRGQLDPRPVITHRFKMEEIDTAMKTMTSPDARVGKVMLLP